ncbi:FliM/FliN family flagellar motor switch protein [Histidinibacterium aquaticum]|uniref:Flagellar motor switch protein FliN-like C-terminal domain-containing protein n=1 Tax=Histidinibacterium aquaticum TaxID=2613962 RepID=A0A5J5GCJ2_9RHOB|nr:flagellar motor switch protein FliM [Histidinibacterium aquaticum]KAA9005623.1 hypothetical protein F3S47_17110 [Histidinibacterium aquaticum]
MTDQDIRTVLARMARAGEGGGPVGAVTPARALRLAVARAVESVAGVEVSVGAVSEEVLDLDSLVADRTGAELILCLDGPAGLDGIAAIDGELRAALVEAQTMGRLSASPAPERPVSVADAALARPVIDAILGELLVAAAPTALAGWTEGLRAGARMESPRAVGLRLAEGSYRTVRLTVDLGVAEREGHLTLALPPERGEPNEEDEGGWSDRMEEAVLGAPAALTAVLHRMPISYERLAALRQGALLPLEGVTVSSVRLEGPGGRLAARGRLGRVSGLKAVRVETPPPPELEDAEPGLSLPGAMETGDVEAAWEPPGDPPGEEELPAMSLDGDADPGGDFEPGEMSVGDFSFDEDAGDAAE